MINNQPNFNQQNNNNKNKKKDAIRIAIIIFCVLTFDLVCFWIGFLSGKLNPKKVFVDFSITEETLETEHKYQFLSKQLSDYICDMSEKLELDSNLVVAILMVENPEFNPEAIHRNENGTIDCGLFQLNDRYIWTTFKAAYWLDNIDLDPFNWKHNAYIAMHHIKSLQDQLKLIDEVIMAYNCGVGAVMNGTVPAVTKVYLAKVKNNMVLLKGVEE